MKTLTTQILVPLLILIVSTNLLYAKTLPIYNCSDSSDIKRINIDKESISEFDSAGQYWFTEKCGSIRRIIEEDENEMIVEVIATGKILRRVRVNKEFLKDSEAKTKGAISALKFKIFYIEVGYDNRDADPMQYYPHYERAKKLTGLVFEEPKQWKEWFDENKDNLVWSEDKDHLVIEKR